MHRHLRSWLLGVLPTLALLLASPAAAAPRLALVIGDAAYPARPLPTTADDAALVAQALAQAGFDVTAARDLDAAGTRATFAAFADAARAAGPEATIFVYLAGYGVQYDGANYLVPVDARLVHDDDVPKEAASLGDLAGTLAAIPAKARLLVYDLDRANPFATADEMPLADGLALAPAPKDTLVAFNAAPGMAAPPAALPYGAYARALAEMIGTPGLPPSTLFDRVRLRVGELTDGSQVPWDDGGEPPAARTRSIDTIPVAALSPDIAYSAVVARDSMAAYAEFLRAFPDGSLSQRVRTLLAVRREALFWQAAMQAGDARALWTYMRRYPHGPHLFDARRRLASLHAPLEPPPRFDIVIFPDLLPPTPAELALVAAPLAAMADQPPIPSPPAALLQPADADYYDALPPPAPALAGLLPIAAPLPHAGLFDAGGSITQTRPGHGAAVTEIARAKDGATLTLADAAGLIAEVAAKTAANGSRTIVETDAKQAVLSRTTSLRTADGLTMVQTGANGGILYEITTLAIEGERVTRVANGQGDLLAAWRRDAQGIVVARDDTATHPAKAEPTRTPQVPPAKTSREPATQTSPSPMRAPAAPQPPQRAAEESQAMASPAPAPPSRVLAPPATPSDQADTVRPASAPPPPPVRPTAPDVRPPPQDAQLPSRPPTATSTPASAPTAETAQPELLREPRKTAPLPPSRPASRQAPAPKRAAKKEPAPLPKRAAKQKPAPAKHASGAAAKHAPAVHKPTSHAAKPPRGAPAHRKPGRH